MRAPALLVAGLMLLCASLPSTAQVVPAGRTLLPGTTRSSVTTPHGSREYLVYAAERAGDAPRPVLVLLHGCTQDAADVLRGSRLARWADGAGGLVVAPEQPAGAHAQKCWNWYDPDHQAARAGEPAIVLAMLDAVARLHPVDPERVYLAGISAGGALAVALAATAPTRFAAVAVHSALPHRVAADLPTALRAMRGEAVPPTLPAAGRAALPPLMAIHGETDRVVAPINTRRLVAQWLGREPADVMDPSPSGLSVAPYAVARSDHRVDGRVRAAEVRIATLGHAWSGGSPEGTYTDPAGPDATAMIIEFLSAHRRRPQP